MVVMHTHCTLIALEPKYRTLFNGVDESYHCGFLGDDWECFSYPINRLKDLECFINDNAHLKQHCFIGNPYELSN